MRGKKSEIDQLTLMADIARRYYEQREKQKDIADALKISQTEVSRNLREAEGKGLIRTTVVDPQFAHELEKELREKFRHLKEVMIVPAVEALSGSVRDPLLEALGKRCAEYFVKVARTNDKIGLGCGVSVAAFVRAYSRMCDGLEYLPDKCEIYQLMIMMMNDMVSVAPAALVASLMRCLPNPIGYAFQFPEVPQVYKKFLRFFMELLTDLEAQGIAVPEHYQKFFRLSKRVGKGDQQDPNPFLEIPVIQQWHNDIEKLDHYFLGIGSIDYEGEIEIVARRNRMATYAFNRLIWTSDKHDDEVSVVPILKGLGAVGECLFQTFDKDGTILKSQPIVHYMKQYCWGLNIEKLRDLINNEKKNKEINIVAIAGGRKKHQSIHASLRAHIFNVLITDSMTANYILEHE